MSETRDFNAIKKQARICGLWYFLLGVTAPIGLLIVPSKLIVSGDAAATAERIRQSEWLMRVGIASELIHQAIVIFLVVELFKLFRHVSEKQAALMVILGALVSVPIVYLNVVNDIAAMLLVKGPKYMSMFDQSQLDAFAYFFLRLHSQGLDVASIFWGLWMFPFAILVMRCGFIPKILGWLMIVAGVGYLAAYFIPLLLPQTTKIVGDVTGIMVIAEVPIMLWLLIFGAREQRPGWLGNF